MPVELGSIDSLHQLLFSIPLQPAQGSRFQPTGFPDLGAATYETEEGNSLLVESAQSMANRMESVCWDEGAQALVPALAGLSYVRVEDKNNAYLTSSVAEAHRLNSVYIEMSNDKQFHKNLAQELQYTESRPVNRPAFVKTVLKYDAGSLVHGLFLESIGGRLRLSRALSAFIEADGFRIAASGGVKNDHVRPGKGKGKGEGEEEGEKGTSKDGFGNVPFHRDEFTAKSITLYVSLDLAQIRGYGLGADATRLLILLSLFKVRGLVDGQLRLRTACNLGLKSPEKIQSTNAPAFALPPASALTADLRASIDACAKAGLFAGQNGVTTVTYSS